MEKKSSGSSRRGTLTSVKAEDIFNKPLTKRELETVRRTAERQAAGDGSHLFSQDYEEQQQNAARYHESRRVARAQAP